jgi:2-keto-4-pentenoate hydratase
MLTDAQRREAAEALFAAERDRAPIPLITDTYPDADVEDAYRISMLVTDMKLAAGRTIKGHKIGLTSKAMRSTTGATEPDYGTLFDDWFVDEGSNVPRERMNMPLVEVELAFVLGAPLVDSIADAAACGFVVLGGNPRRLTDIDIRRIGASLSKNGEIEETGVASAVMGNPINAIAWLANKLHEFGVTMQPGHVVLSGSFIKAVPFGAGDSLVALFDTLGEVTLKIT